MIELINVQLKNFRSFADSSFTPLGIGQGLTAINGSNGMGKSTIVHAVVWALYGITPDGVRVGALRRQGSEGEGDVEAKVTINFNGQTICVTRGLRGKNDTTIASIELDGVEQTNVSSRTASQWITNYIGLDAEAFLTAFVVRQKELDSLVRARPAERRKTIERLAGIERMSKALELARQNSREAQRLVEALPATADPSTLETEIVAVEEEINSADTALESLTQALEKVSSDRTRIGENLKAARAHEASLIQARQSLGILETRISDLEEKISALTLKASGAEKVEEFSQELKAAQEAEVEAEEALTSYQSLKQELLVAQSGLRSAKAAAVKIQSEKDKLTESLENSKNDLAGLKLVDNSTITDLDAALDKASEELGSAKSNLTRMKKALDTINEHISEDGHASCPTCEQAIADPTAIREALALGITEYKNQVEASEESIKSLREKLQEAKQAQKAYNDVAGLITNLETQLDNVEQEAADILESQDSAVSAVAELEAALEQLGDETALSAARKDAALRKDEAAENLRTASSAQAAADELEAAEVALEKRQSEKQEIEDQMAVLPDSDEDPASLERDYEEANESVLTATTQKQQAEYEVNTLRARKTALLDELQEAQASNEARVKALRDAEVKASVAQALADFRTDRLARLTPELSEVATDFVARMTDGKYTSVVLDDEFTPVLTDAAGNERPVAWLSGGEESAVALALRVAIGEVLAGQKGGLLVLDEVLTAQDASRRQSTMSAIKALPRQIITINHVSEATDMVDLVANIVEDGAGASTIEEWAPDVLGGKVDDLEFASAE